MNDVLRSSGQPLDRSTREAMETQFQHDFGKVRIHTDQRAAESAQEISAFAYTVGPHIAFGRGRFLPATPAGRQLLAHELTHVVQQDSANPSGGQLELGAEQDLLEKQAQAEEARNGLAFTTPPLAKSYAPTVQRAPDNGNQSKTPPDKGWWPDEDLWISLGADDPVGCRFGDFVDLQSSPGKHKTCEGPGPVNVCRGEPLVFYVAFFVDHVNSPHPSPKGFVVSALFELTNRKGEKKVLLQARDSAPKYVGPNRPLVPSFSSDDYKVRMPVSEEGRVDILLQLHEPSWNIDMTYNGWIDLALGPCPPGTETGIYLLVPEPDKAPLVYKRVTGKEAWQKPPAVIVTVWSDDRGYYYNSKAGRVRLPERP